MEILLIIVLSLAKGGIWAFNLTEHAGRSIIIKCDVTQEQNKAFKNFCKKGHAEHCDEQINNTLSGKKWTNKGRFSLYDKTEQNFFKVSLRNLTKNDTGTYWCGVGNRKVDGTDVHLKVIEGKRESMDVSGFTGQNVTIQCHYKMEYKNETKYMCKNEAVACKDKIRTKKTENSKERFSLYDNTAGGFFMVSIINLTKEDAGTYWCGVHVSFPQNSKLSADNYSEVILKVMDESQSLGVLVEYTHGLVVGCLTAVVVVSVSVVFMCWRRRRNNRKDLASGSNVEAHNNRESGHTDCEYETILEPAVSFSRVTTETEASAVYANAQLPTVLSDDPTYSTVQMPTIQSDDPTYSTAQLPSMQSGQPPYSNVKLLSNPTGDCVYSTVDLPITLSDDPTYSTVQLPNTPFA